MRKNMDGYLKKTCVLVFSMLLGMPTFPMLNSAEVKAAESSADKNGRVIVSMGDSYSSGEGIDPFYDYNKPMEERVQSEDWLAHRSQKSWPGRLSLPKVDGKMSQNRDENWFFVASSGATTEHIMGKQKKEYHKSLIYKGTKYLPSQIKVLNDLRTEGVQVDYVTMTMGGNDAKFSDIITASVVDTGLIGPNILADKLANVWTEFYAKDGIRDKLYKAYHDIAAAAPQAKIIIAGYPKLLDETGKDILFSKEEGIMINEAVENFNKEIENLVNHCKSEGMKICFVSVEEAFEGHGAYTDEPYINAVTFGCLPQDIKDIGIASDYSIHPNDKGAQAYAECVQAKIDELEKDGGKSEWPLMSSSDVRDVVLVLDSSGSMSGTPIQETKEAATKFVNTILDEEASVGLVTYDSDVLRIADFNMHSKLLNDSIDNIVSGGGTNIEAGLREAEEMLSESRAEKKIIVLMSDGQPNEGAVGDELIAYADEIKKQGIYIYTLGFFESLGSEKSMTQALMEGIASDGCHYEVTDAEDLIFFFGDIADHINGQKYIYIRIACPVDVEVSYKGEKMVSKGNVKGSRTSFGTLTFEENDEEKDGTKNSSYNNDEKNEEDRRIKILRLKDGVDYDIKIEGNGKGRMDYTIGLMDDSGEYADMREFSNIKITKRTEIDTVASNASSTVLKVDDDGDGKYDITYMAEANGEGRVLNNNYFYAICVVTSLSTILLLVVIIAIIKEKKRLKKATVNLA